MNKNSRGIAAILVCVAFAHGCGGGGGSSSGSGSGSGSNGVVSDSAPSTGSGAAANASGAQLSGKVIDGYIEGATVCVDLNGDRKCNAGEPSAVTGVGGLYSIDTSGIDQSTVASSNLVVIIPDTAKDADDGGKTLAEAGKAASVMMAPVNLTTPSNHLITPLTTLVAEKMLNSGLTEAAATDWVRSRVGLNPTDALNVDYKSDLGAYRELADLAAYMFDTQNTLTRDCVIDESRKATWDNLTGVQDCARLGLLRAAFGLSLVGPRYDGSLAPETKALLDVLWANVYAYRNIEAGLRQYFDPGNTMLATDLAAGISEFRDTAISPTCAADPGCPTQGYFRVRTSKVTSGTFTVSDAYAIQQPNFVPNATTMEYWQLVGGQWVSVPSGMTLQARADGDFGFTGGPFGTTGVTMSAHGLKLAGLALNLAGLNRFAADRTFPAGSYGYLLSYKTSTERYVLSGTPVQGPGQTPLAGSLSDAYPSSAPPSWVNALASRTGLWMTFAPAVNGAGVVSFRNPDVPNQVLPQTGTYQLAIVDGQLIAKISEIPSEVLAALATFNPSAKVDYDRGVRPIFGVTADGSMREGTYTPVSVLPSGGPQLNRVALNALLQALSLCQLDDSGANTACPQ